MMELIGLMAGKLPMLGICLGHQALIAHYGGTIGRAEHVMHGKASDMVHDGSPLFEGMANPLSVARYHSLVGHVVPDCLHVPAKVDELPMAVVHPKDRAVGYQFHPESILTEQGAKLLNQTLNLLIKDVPLC
jgi:anthranilate synthase component 2